MAYVSTGIRGVDLLLHEQLRLTNLFKIKAFLALVSLKPMSVSCLRLV